jgi:hypothetical protein
MPGSARALARLSVHPRPEVREPLLGDPPVGSRDRAGVLLEGVEHDGKIAGPVVKETVSS